MGKSIRSKIKRKHRAEFRSTVGTVAFESNSAKVQAKLKENIKKQTFHSIDKISEQLDTIDQMDTLLDNDNESVTSKNNTSKIWSDDDDNEALLVRGENKVIVNKKAGRKRKHSYKMKAIERKHGVQSNTSSNDSTDKKRRFHCQF